MTYLLWRHRSLWGLWSIEGTTSYENIRCGGKHRHSDTSENTDEMEPTSEGQRSLTLDLGPTDVLLVV